MKKRKKLTEAQRKQRQDAVEARWKKKTPPRLTKAEAIESRYDEHGRLRQLPRGELANIAYRSKKAVGKMRGTIFDAKVFKGASKAEHPPLACRLCGVEMKGKDQNAKFKALRTHARRKHPEAIPPKMTGEEFRALFQNPNADGVFMDRSMLT